MTKADNYLVADIKNILMHGCKDKNPRPHYADGRPAHTLFVTHNWRQYDLNNGEFPITTLRPIAWKSAIKEVMWIYQDKTSSLDELHKRNVKAWDNWDIGNGTIGYRYGHTVNRWDIFEKRVLKDIKENPYGRYHICNLWQEQEFEDEPNGLKPCAYETIWTVRSEKGKEYLDMFLNQRSGDALVASGAGNWNEVQYAALLMMVARHTGYLPGKFTHSVVNEQIYLSHIEGAREMLDRYNRMKTEGETSYYKCPSLKLSGSDNFYEMTIDDFTMENYEPMKPQISFELGI